MNNTLKFAVFGAIPITDSDSLFSGNDLAGTIILTCLILAVLGFIAYKIDRKRKTKKVASSKIGPGNKSTIIANELLFGNMSGETIKLLVDANDFQIDYENQSFKGHFEADSKDMMVEHQDKEFHYSDLTGRGSYYCSEPGAPFGNFMHPLEPVGTVQN